MSAVVASAKENEELSCVLIPTSGLRLLLPNVSVAEIVPSRRMKTLEHGPSWCLGFVGWRGRTVPVVHYPGLSGDASEQSVSPRCMVIMNRARSVSSPPFYALAAEGLPRMLQLADGDIDTADGELGPADVMHVCVGTETAIIPNLRYIEERLVELGNPF